MNSYCFFIEQRVKYSCIVFGTQILKQLIFKKITSLPKVAV